MPDKMLVGRIDHGIVIDHISPCKSLLILKLLNPGPDALVVIAKNVSSSKYGKKDLLKIEGEYLTSTQIDTIALISPGATVNRIQDYAVKEKQVLRPPSNLMHLIDCRNPNCPSKGSLSNFKVSIQDPIERSYFECVSCSYRVYYDDAIEQILGKASTGILISREKIQRELLDLLIRKGGLRLGQQYKLKSGRMSPYFVNLGALNDGESLSKLRWILAGFSRLLLDEHKIRDFDYVFGPAYKGINLAALTCQGLSENMGLNKRYLYDRKEIKQYGDLAMDKEIVGFEYFKQGQSILIVDDTVTTGTTKLESIEKLSSLGKYVLAGVVVCVDRQEILEGGKTAVQQLRESLGVEIHPIITASIIYNAVKGILTKEQRAAWVDYYDKYGSTKLE